MGIEISTNAQSKSIVHLYLYKYIARSSYQVNI